MTADNSNSDLPLALFLMGPTASGKTDLAIALHKYLPIDIISVDSALVYKGLDIGSAKPTAEELAQAPHRLIDICDPAEPYSAAQFVRDARREMADITAKGRIPLLVGGTMLYFKALLEGLSNAPAVDPEIRATIEQEAAEQGWPALHAQLALIDPVTAAQLHPNHSQRIQRALEVYRATGTPLSIFQQQHQEGGAGTSITEEYRITQLALLPRDRNLLHRRIEQRFSNMLASGFEEEVRQLYQRRDLHANLPAIRAVGYRQMWDYLSDDINYEEMAEKGVIATRQLAKRQLTWLRNWSTSSGELHELWIDKESGELNDPEDILTNCLKIVRKAPI